MASLRLIFLISSVALISSFTTFVSAAKSPIEIPDCFRDPLDDEETTSNSIMEEHEGHPVDKTQSLFCMGSEGDIVSLGRRTGCFARQSCQSFLSVQSTRYGFKFWDIYVLRKEGFPVQGVKLFISPNKIHVPRSLNIQGRLVAEGMIDSANNIKSRSYIHHGENDDGQVEEDDKSSDQFSFKPNGLKQAALVDIYGRLFTHFAFYTIERIKLNELEEVHLESHDFFPFTITFAKDGNDSAQETNARVMQLDHPINLRDNFIEEEETARVESFVVGSPEPPSTTTTTRAPRPYPWTSRPEKPVEEPVVVNAPEKRRKPPEVYPLESVQEEEEDGWFNCWNILVMVTAFVIFAVLVIFVILFLKHRRQRRSGHHKVATGIYHKRDSRSSGYKEGKERVLFDKQEMRKASRVPDEIDPPPDHNHNQEDPLLKTMEPITIPESPA